MKKLKERWLSKEGFELHNSIIGCFLENAKLSNIPGLARHEGRWDLRGMTLPLQAGPNKPFTVNNYTLENADLSYSTLYESGWVKCAFHNVVFLGTKADYSKFWACIFKQVKFEKSNLNEVVMNGTLKGETGAFKNVDFIESNLKGTVHSNTLFEGCNFTNCQLDHVDFHASRFVNCKFSGHLNEVFFRGAPDVNQKLFPNATQFPNEMINVDFSEATLESVMFLDAIDLSHCTFPLTGEYIIITKNRNEIFEEARKIIDLTWEGLNKRMGLGLIDQSYLGPKKIRNSGEVIDKHYLVRTDRDFGVKFFDLLSDLNKKADKKR